MQLKPLLLPLILILTACATPQPPPEGTAVRQPLAGAAEHALLQQLYSQHREWQGTPYRIGGQSRQGIDCSGFVQQTYRSRLGVALPRTTEQQVVIGSPVDAQGLTAGDLIFFLIDGSTRHVGIYLDNDRFLHASKSRGVMISDLTNPYWRANYWQARRVL